MQGSEITNNIHLNYYKDDWVLDEVQCPCDIHFVEWIRKMHIKNSSIFHFGTGGHHYVGTECASHDLKNAIYGITASPQEYYHYINIAINNPLIGRYYKVFFGDIYQIEKKLLPEFDVVTLFHLCEFYNEEMVKYDAITDLDIAEIFTGALRSGGYILFYNGSSHFKQAVNVIESLVKNTELIRMEDYRSLLVFQKT